ncbi:NAD(P)-dependent alcohol dehydrogenase [Microterricola viridarii]|uniref:L-iditol 2-dehydrogenase n=1 Tax=Microterricola viridarii TaxID=412690 RepID=A0A1H1L8V2_9MICO|nr:NAD(P)-dependent alcohol dehydrogenase [Microterricola viridarii]SDR70666.1 L-iditol 2-dehydrogenase [Microterricola viridarii]SDR70722.1 L-iditol 2-dehydrogenase [Microterricola viridarii]SDT35650.1 L-iditol 2-dehydrogenase [Microterricola viridarii]
MTTTPVLPETMRVSQLDAAHSVRLTERPVPTPGASEVLVRVAAVGVCGSDTHYYEHGRIGPFVVTAPLVLGHEASGTIVAVGSGVDAARIGSRVSIEPQKPCRACEQCKAGRYNLCAAMEFFATPPIDGAFAEYVLIEQDFAHDVPDSISDASAALVEPLSVGIAACHKAEVTAGSRVLIAGAGPIGVITAQVARAFGAVEVHISDVSEPRLAFALQHGATHAHLAGAPLEHLAVDAFIDASGAAPAIRAGIPAVRPAGRVILVGLGADSLEMPVNLIQNNELWVTGVFRYANTWPTAIALLANGSVNLDALVTGSFGLDEVEAALTASRDGASMKTIVTPAS